MAKSINSVVVATDTFSSLITKTNQVITAIGTEVITANNSNDGANTTGNTNLIGIFGANSIAVGTGIRGGTVNAAANLTISSNAIFVGTNTSFSSNLIITNSTTAVNAVMTISGPTLSVSSNATFNANVTMAGNRLVIGSNASFTGANTTLGSANTNISGNNFIITSNTVNITSNAVNITSNTLFTGSIEVSNTITLLGDIKYGPAGVYGVQTSAANTSLGVTLGSPLPVYSWAMADYKGADITSVVKNGVTVRVSRFLVVTDGTNAFITEYATLHSPAVANLGVYTVTASPTHVIINFTQTAINSSVTLNISLTA